jgi:hypothetical protein
MEATPMTPRVLDYAQAAFRKDLALLADAGEAERAEGMAELRGLAPQIGLSFDDELAAIERPTPSAA